MYNINTGQARTDLFGIGKGLAQVVDLTNPRRVAAEEVQRQDQQKHADQLARERQKKDLFDQLAKLDASPLKPNDVVPISNEISNLHKELASKFNSDGTLSPQDELEFQRKATDIKMRALASANAKQYHQEQLKKVAAEPEGTYDEEEVQKIRDALVHPDYAGKYNTDLPLNKNFNFGQYVSKVLAPAADRQAANQPVGGRKIITPEQAADFIVRDLTGEKFRAVSKEMERDKKAGLLPEDYHDVNEYAIKKYSPELIQNAPLFAPQRTYTGVGSAAEKGIVDVTYNPNTGYQTAKRRGETSPQAKDVNIDGRSVRILPPAVKFNPKTGLIEAAKIEVVPTPTQQAENAKVDAFNLDQDEKIQKYVEKHVTSKSDAAKIAQVKKTAESLYPKESVTHPKQTVDIKSPDKAEEIYEQYWGHKPQEAKEGIEGVNYIEVEHKPNEVKAKTYIINGNKWTHDELIKNGYSEKQINNAIKAGIIK